MIDIAAYELNKYYGSNHVIKTITFEIYSCEKVGLLGRNGSGKTTLFKVITGDEPYESGSLSKASGKKIEMLAQIPVFGETDTTEDVLRSSFKDISDIYNEMKKIEEDINHGSVHPENPGRLARYGSLMEEYERLGGYDTEVKLSKVCSGMGIDERMMKSSFINLSGGEKTRVNLARILLRDCEILLLDEPTNHLDLISLEWLEKFLRDFPGTVVTISHDRAFLDSVVTRIIEIEDGKANFYTGNYSYYIEEKARRFLTQTEQYEQQQKKIHQLEAAAKRLHEWARKADNEALHKRAFAIEKRIERMDKVEKPLTARKLTAGFNGGGYAAKEIVSFESVSKSYGTKTILNDLNLSIYRNDRIALIGANGCGKSTLLKMILKEEPCDNGDIKVSVNVKPEYMSQIIEFEDENATVLDVLRFGSSLPAEKARSILAGFNFKANDVVKKVGSLSGGEKSRLRLCLMMRNNVNFLLLDEPTNHLDIASREWIENALADFEGTILFVSHDRYFLDKFADKVWSMEDGKIVKYDYGFYEYLEKVGNDKAENEKITQNKKDKPQVRREGKKGQLVKSASRISSASLVSAEELITEAESKLKEINDTIDTIDAADSHPLKSDFTELTALFEDKLRLEERIEELYSQWIGEN